MEPDSSLKLASFIRGRAPALALEVLAIVFSILLAFLIDAWWDARGDRTREQAYIAKLIGEFEAGRNELEADLDARGELLRGWARLLRAPAPKADSLGPIVTSLIEFRFYTPVHAVFDDLISSGGLNLLRSDALRTALFEYAQERERVASGEAAEQQLITQTVVPYLVSEAEFLPWIPQSGRDSLGISPGPATRDPGKLLQDPTFTNMLYLRWVRGVRTQRFSMQLHEAVVQVVQLLHAQAKR
jgi:hypothetical protein